MDLREKLHSWFGIEVSKRIEIAVVFLTTLIILLGVILGGMHFLISTYESEPNIGVTMDYDSADEEVLFEEMTPFAAHVDYVYVLSDDVPYERFSSELVDSEEMISYSGERVDSSEYERFLIFEGEYSDSLRESPVKVDVSGYESGSFTVIAVLDSKEFVLKEFSFSESE